MAQTVKDARAKLANLRPKDFHFRISQGFEGICPLNSEFLTLRYVRPNCHVPSFRQPPCALQPQVGHAAMAGGGRVDAVPNPVGHIGLAVAQP